MNEEIRRGTCHGASVQGTAGETALQTFTFNPGNQPVRVEIIGGEPWFVAKDVCDALTIEKHRDAVSRLDDDERGSVVVDTLGGKQSVSAVNESGLYNLIFQSRKPEAKVFRKWVTGEVLPSIRKTGSYSLPGVKGIKNPVARIRRDRRELVNKDLMELLWLIGESLVRGDQRDIAMQLGVSVITVQNTLNGYSRNAKVLRALYQRAWQRRGEFMLYNEPKEMARRLLLQEGSPDGRHLPPHLPPLRITGTSGRGGQLGNQNARKNKCPMLQEGGAR
ncbi:MAG: Bro-N domain-containing protein [Bacteroidales bacterium]|nr:Bro-N domain-containing protein [Bacteroidales bacterium]